jgi:hypothetical protein
VFAETRRSKHLRAAGIGGRRRVGQAGEFHVAFGVRFVGSKYRRCGGFE